MSRQAKHPTDEYIAIELRWKERFASTSEESQVTGKKLGSSRIIDMRLEVSGETKDEVVCESLPGRRRQENEYSAEETRR